MMDTPKNLRQRPARNPTPRLSERKKSLFETISQVDQVNSESDSYSLDGIEPLNNNNNNNDVQVKDTNAEIWSAKGLIPKTPKTSKRISFLRNNNSFSPERMDDDLFEKLPDSPPSKDSKVTSPLRRSSRLSLKPKNRSPSSTNSTPSTSAAVNGKENMPRSPPEKMASDELPALFTNSMNLNKNKKSTEEIVNESSSEDESQNPPRALAPKRNHLTSSDGTSPTSAAKIRRLENSKRLAVSTKSFYSHKRTSPQKKSPPIAVLAKRGRPRGKLDNIKRSPGLMINKGVHHKIRRKPNYKLSSTVLATKSNVMEILGTIRNEKLRKLLTEKRVQNDQIEHVHRILKSAKNPIEMAKPLSVFGTCTNNNSEASVSPAGGRCYMNGVGNVSHGFSDIECSSDSEAELQDVATQPDIDEIIDEPEDRTPTPVAAKKFFKSGLSTTKKEFKVTDNIRASVCNGKMSIMQQRKPIRKKIKLRNNNVNEFSSEQAKVDEILKNFDISLIAPCDEEVDPPVSHVNQIEEACPTAIFLNEACDTYDDGHMTDEDTEFDEFRRRLPYNTTDPNMIEQQHTLLDFLITNKICTEENFTIFIGDPENNKEQAQHIIDQLVVVLNESPDAYRQRVPHDTTDPIEIDRQKNFLEFLIENNLCNEENFQIFIADYANRHEEADRIITEVVATTHNISADDLERELNNFNYKESMAEPLAESMEMEIPDQNKQNQKVLENSPEKLFPIFYPGRCQPLAQQTSSRKLCKTWMGMGLKQYQIDAGQKQFGAKQCKQCGLVYTVHEPEEEKLHKEFHASLYVLKFKSWIDEDIVQIYPEWGSDGRILRISEKSYVKRLERLKDVLKIVDKELGFISYILPTHFKAYFAVRQNQIVGLCLAEPLDKAHRYISMNGIDCCTDETYDAKCGISRIWVSPLHRRFHIASKLIRAVQLYTIFSEEIPLDKIAFSAPTEEGKKFAQKVTKTENFLVYQQ